MDNPQKQEATAQFTREEKSVLVDVLNWYEEEYDLSNEEEENVEKCINELEENQLFDTRLMDVDLLCDTVINRYADELQPYLADFDNPESAADFYRKNFSSITEKLQKADNRY